jgi:hypothetical protein
MLDKILYEVCNTFLDNNYLVLSPSLGVLYALA